MTVNQAPRRDAGSSLDLIVGQADPCTDSCSRFCGRAADVRGQQLGSAEEPVGFRMYEIGITLVAGPGLIGLGIWQSVQATRLSPLLLMAVATGTAFWQETYGDWGAYLLVQRSVPHL